MQTCVDETGLITQLVKAENDKFTYEIIDDFWGNGLPLKVCISLHIETMNLCTMEHIL